MTALPTLYEFYTSNGINKGLTAEGDEFKLNEKSITLFSGAIHYFRVHPNYWRDRIQKLKACGLNCIETYIPWNLHEPQKDLYDFGKGKNQMSIFCDLQKYIEIAQEEDLFVIIRPGPYICAEWEFGGMPAYLLSDDGLILRTSNSKFMERVAKYFSKLFEILSPFQFTKGGPIIAFQIENEYGNVKEEGKEIDVNYLLMLKKIMEEKGVVELLFTSDTPSLGFSGTIPGVLATANFQENPEKELELLRSFQPNKPLMVMEFWTGWFDHWTEAHQTRSLESFRNVLEAILKKGASVNFYMFHGGTNWGFYNGANNFNGDYQADTTSYDYDCLLSEAGHCTKKYFIAKELIEKYKKVQTYTKIAKIPADSRIIAYPKLLISGMIRLEDFTFTGTSITSNKILTMETLPICQNFGYILYRKSEICLPPQSELKINGKIRDQAIILIKGELKSKPLNSIDDLNDFGYWRSKNSTLNLNNNKVEKATLDILICNWARINFGKLADFKQHKGLLECEVFLNEEQLNQWTITSLDFEKKSLEKLPQWSRNVEYYGPALYKAELYVEILQDTYLDMRSWNQGIVIVNNFVLGRYCSLGPQHTLYLPGPLLVKGLNTILIFEHFKSSNCVEFSDLPQWENGEQK